jgi:putative nucleotidyltransferase with HDIG domain
MMTEPEITRDVVIERSSSLPAFPLVIRQIVATIDDPEASTEMLAGHIRHDPVIAARVLSLANAAATGTRRQTSTHDIFTAASLIGMNRVREMALLAGVSGFVADMAPPGMTATFWQHSVAVGVCSEEIALHTAAPASASAALIAGLLHDVGQLWLYRFNADRFSEAWPHALAHGIAIEQAERECFGVDHTVIGAWLAEHWTLPAGIVAAIRGHHAPELALGEPLVPVVHVAEVVSNALDLTGREENHVTSISSAACRALGLTWDERARVLFGRVEARSRHANTLFGA